MDIGALPILFVKQSFRVIGKLISATVHYFKMQRYYKKSRGG